MDRQRWSVVGAQIEPDRHDVKHGHARLFVVHSAAELGGDAEEVQGGDAEEVQGRDADEVHSDAAGRDRR
jgi:hypothetical protein